MHVIWLIYDTTHWYAPWLMNSRYVPWLMNTCVMIHIGERHVCYLAHIRHDSLICAVTHKLSICAVTHKYMCHDTHQWETCMLPYSYTTWLTDMCRDTYSRYVPWLINTCVMIHISERHARSSAHTWHDSLAKHSLCDSLLRAVTHVWHDSNRTIPDGLPHHTITSSYARRWHPTSPL